MQFNKRIIFFVVILILAAYFRLYGVNWDQGQHLHPDERFLTMVTDVIQWPKSLFEYLDSASSPLNPHNKGFSFFVYGTFPIFFTKWFIDTFAKEDYNSITLIGRQLSAVFDLGTVILVFLIAKELVKSSKYKVASIKKKLLTTYYLLHATFPLLSMFLYSVMVLPIQLSHFYAVDTYLTFFLTLTFYFLIKIINTNPKKLTTYYLLLTTYLGIAFGLALASKISAVLFSPIIALGFLYFLIKNKSIPKFLILNSAFLILSYLTFRLAQPYLFAKPNLFDLTLNQKVVDNWEQLKSFDDPSGGFPPSVQWITTKPYLFPLKNMLLWGLGLPLGLISILSIIFLLSFIFYSIIKRKFSFILNSKFLILNLSLIWILLLFFYQGSQFVKALRYFYPIYPFLALLSAYFLIQCYDRLKKYQPNIVLLFVICYLLFVLIYPISFLSVYSRPHTRVAASEWIYKNIPAGSIRSSEVWDDGLPLSLPTPGFINEKYPVLEFPLYYPDNDAKWQEMSLKLQKVNYIILTSNRLYGSIMTTPQKYPVTNKYYQMLFDGSLGFEKIAEFTSRPNIPIPFLKICLTPPFVRYGIVALKSQECNQSGISLVDDYADETFTVYDHPKVIIFKKVKEVDYLKALYQKEI